MAEELFCEKHGPYPASAKVCPHCARERSDLPPAPTSLYSDDVDVTQSPEIAASGYSDDDETVYPGKAGKHSAAYSPVSRVGEADETIPPTRGRGRADDEDDEKTQAPVRKHGGSRFLDDDDNIEETRIRAKEQTGPLGWLIVKSSSKYTNMRRGRIIEFRSGTIFGRSSKAHVVINDEDVSALHAVVKIEEDKFFVADMASSNGTFVNGAKITGGVEIQQDDEITIGDTVFVLKTLR